MHIKMISRKNTKSIKQAEEKIEWGKSRSQVTQRSKKEKKNKKEKWEQIECKNKTVERHYNRPVINIGGLNSSIMRLLEWIFWKVISCLTRSTFNRNLSIEKRVQVKGWKTKQ